MKKHRALWPWIWSFVLGTALLTGWHGWNADHAFRSDLLRKIQGLAAALTLQRLDHLSATAEDLHSPIYRRLKNQLDNIFPLYPEVQYIYLMRQQPDGSIVFLLDSSPDASPPDLALPGQPYPETSPKLRQAISHSTPAIVGPMPDSWRTWVSALVPLPTLHPTLVGMDVPQETYWRRLLLACLPPLTIGAAGALLFARVWRTQWQHRDCLLTALVGITISGQAALAVWVLEHDAREHVHALLGTSQAQQLRTQITMAQDHMLGNLARFYASSEEVTPSEFLTFTQSWRTNPTLDVAGFIAQGSRVLSPATEPGLVGMPLIQPELVWAIQESTRTELATAVLTTFFGRPTPSLVLVQPVWKGSRLLGHALVSLDLARLLQDASEQNPLSLEELGPTQALSRNDVWPIFVGGRTFILSVTTPAFDDIPPGTASGAALLFGIIVTTLAARLTHEHSHRRQILSRILQRRTKQLGQALRRFQALYTNALTGIALHELVRDRHGVPATYRYLDANPAFTQHTGLKVENIRGKTVEQALGVAEPPFLSTFAAVVESQAAVSFSTEFAPLGRHFLINSFPLPEPDTFATVLLDTTAWIQTEAAQNHMIRELHKTNTQLEEAVERIGQLAAQAEAAQQAKERFITMLSHDLRAPAAGALSAAKLLAHEELSAKGRDLVAGIHASAQGMLDLLEDTLTLSSLENGGLPILQQHLDVTSTLAEAAASLAPLAHAKGLELTTTLPSLPPVLGDARRIRQLATNLLSNAIKFTEVGSVQLLVREIERTVDTLILEIRVTDTGPGIPAEDHGRIFQPYGQRDPSRDGTMGVGLGLALCREIATRMGGSIGVESAPGQGASFWVQLPLPLAPEHSDLPRKVLLADDDPVARTLALTWLTRQGIAAVVVEDGNAALTTLLAEADIEAAILDLSMPGISGLELARRIRQGQGGVRLDLPLVALTAADTEGHACAAAGFDAYLTKPVDAEALKFALMQAVASRTETA
jgi:signal transduction histidine kinase/ActR/RegA family two-component response regulator